MSLPTVAYALSVDLVLMVSSLFLNSMVGGGGSGAEWWFYIIDAPALARSEPHPSVGSGDQHCSTADGGLDPWIAKEFAHACFRARFHSCNLQHGDKDKERSPCDY